MNRRRKRRGATRGSRQAEEGIISVNVPVCNPTLDIVANQLYLDALVEYITARDDCSVVLKGTPIHTRIGSQRYKLIPDGTLTQVTAHGVAVLSDEIIGSGGTYTAKNFLRKLKKGKIKKYKKYICKETRKIQAPAVRRDVENTQEVYKKTRFIGSDATGTHYVRMKRLGAKDLEEYLYYEHHTIAEKLKMFVKAAYVTREYHIESNKSHNDARSPNYLISETDEEINLGDFEDASPFGARFNRSDITARYPDEYSANYKTDAHSLGIDLFKIYLCEYYPDMPLDEINAAGRNRCWEWREDFLADETDMFSTEPVCLELLNIIKDSLAGFRRRLSLKQLQNKLSVYIKKHHDSAWGEEFDRFTLLRHIKNNCESFSYVQKYLQKDTIPEAEKEKFQRKVKEFLQADLQFTAAHRKIQHRVLQEYKGKIVDYFMEEKDSDFFKTLSKVERGRLLKHIENMDALTDFNKVFSRFSCTVEQAELINRLAKGEFELETENDVTNIIDIFKTYPTLEAIIRPKFEVAVKRLLRRNVKNISARARIKLIEIFQCSKQKPVNRFTIFGSPRNRGQGWTERNTWNAGPRM